MSTNILNIRKLNGSLSIEPDVLYRLCIEHEDRLPETNFLNQLRRNPTIALVVGPWPIDKVSWTGEGSGNSFDLLQEVLAACTGNADLFLVWEDGDISGLRVHDGSVQGCYVEQVLIPWPGK